MSKEYSHVAKTGPGEMVLLRRGQAMPENAVSMLESDVYDLQIQRIAKFKPFREMIPFYYGPGLLSLVTATSAYHLNKSIRKAFNLGSLKIGLIGLPAVAIPAMTTYAVHDMWTKRNILLGREPCASCVMLKSGLVMAASGVLYPYVISIVTCMSKAREYYTLPFPEGRSKGGFLKLLYRVSPPNTSVLGFTLLNMIAGFVIAGNEFKLFNKYLLNPPSSSESEMAIDIGVEER